MTVAKPTIPFVCTHNAGDPLSPPRSPAPSSAIEFDADSAGVSPADDPSGVTIASLAEVGIDDSAHQLSRLTHARVRAADVVVAMKPGLDLPHFPGVKFETWTLPDPAGWDIDGIRGLRDDIDTRVQVLIADLGTS